jgi:hypothetical protein
MGCTGMPSALQHYGMLLGGPTFVASTFRYTSSVTGQSAAEIISEEAAEDVYQAGCSGCCCRPAIIGGKCFKKYHTQASRTSTQLGQGMVVK